MALRRLILLTNQYPFTTGDFAFVRQEIEALAARFDEVFIFNYTAGPPAPIADLPANTVYAGNLYGASTKNKIAALVAPASVLKLAKVIRGEAGAGALRGHLKAFFSAAAVGMSLARDSRLRRLLSAPETRTTVYSFWGMGAGMAVPWLAAGLAGVVVRVHGYDLYEELTGYLPFRRAIFGRADRILPISETGRAYLRNRYPDAQLTDKIAVRRLGSKDPYLNAPEPVKGIAASSPAERIVVSCSNIIELKRVHRIAEALALVSTEHPLRWVHFGGGVLADEVRQVADTVRQDGLAIDLPGVTNHEDIMDFYRSNPVAAFINVSTTEGVPVSIMEAISCGIPAIATDVGGTAEIVGAGLGTGELISPDFTKEDLARAIERMLAAAPGTYSPRTTWAKLYNADINAARTAALVVGDGPSDTTSAGAEQPVTG